MFFQKSDTETVFFWVVVLLVTLLLLLLLGEPAEAAEANSAGTSVAFAGDFAQSAVPSSARTRRDLDEVTFRYLDDDFESVAVSGSFNDWEPVPMTLDEDGDVWSVTLSLEPGRHRYQFLVEDAVENWTAIDPSNPHARRLEGMGWFSLITVPEDGDRFVGGPRGPSPGRGRSPPSSRHGEPPNRLDHLAILRTGVKYAHKVKLPPAARSLAVRAQFLRTGPAHVEGV